MSSSVEALMQLSSRNCGAELCFTRPNAIEAVKVCSTLDIAVLGVEMFQVQENLLLAEGCSDYELQVQPTEWKEYVLENNRLADASIREYPDTNGNHVYILTTIM
jgi:hypothetical protein